MPAWTRCSRVGNRFIFYLNSSSLMMPACTRCSRVGNRFFRRKLTVLAKINSSIACNVHTFKRNRSSSQSTYKSTEQCLASSELLTPHPLSTQRVCPPPHQRGGGGVHTRQAADARHWIGLLQYNPSTYLLALFLVTVESTFHILVWENVYLKVHKIEIFFGFDFEICIISLLVMSKY